MRTNKERPYALGLDASTQSCSAVVIDVGRGVVVAEVSVSFGERLGHYGAPHGFIPGGVDGEVHADPCMWLDALELLLEELGRKCDLSKVGAISGAGQQHGSVYLGESWFSRIGTLSVEQSLSGQLGSAFTRSSSPIWMDSSTSVPCGEIAAAVGGQHVVCAKTGSVAVERFSGPQIRRFYQQCPDAYQRTARIHLVSSFLCSVLIGKDAAIDTGDGAGMNLLNISTWDWDRDLLEATAPGLFEKLPALRPGESVAGVLDDYFVAKYGLAPKVPVTIFTGDNPSSLVGMGASRVGKVVISLGTSDTFFAAMPGVQADPDGFGHVFGNPSGGAMSLQCFVNGSLAREAVKDRFGYDWDQFAQAFSQTPCGNQGNRMVPFYRPETSPRVRLDGPLLRGSAGFENWQDPDAAVRACVEGQFLNMKRRTGWMELEPEVIYLTGGASRNDAIAQVVADVFQAKVQRLAVSSSVSMGAAMRAACQSMEVQLEKLESDFCRPVEGSAMVPKASPEVYAEAGRDLDQMIESVSD